MFFKVTIYNLSHNSFTDFTIKAPSKKHARKQITPDLGKDDMISSIKPATSPDIFSLFCPNKSAKETKGV